MTHNSLFFTAGCPGVPQCFTYIIMWGFLDLLVSMIPSVGALLIGAVQRALDCLVADIKWS